MKATNNRCSILLTAVITLVGVPFCARWSAEGASQVKKEADTSFGPMKQIDAGLLNVGYIEGVLIMPRRMYEA
jgi:hypothetical protein